MRRLLTGLPPGLRQRCLQKVLTAGAHPANAAEGAAALQPVTVPPNLSNLRCFSDAAALDAPSMSASAPAAAGGSPQPKPYQPAAPDAAAEPRAPEHAASSTDAAAAAQDGIAAQSGTIGGVPPPQPAARNLTREELQEMSQAAHRVQQEMSDLLTQRKPDEALQLFEEHVAKCLTASADAQSAVHSDEQRATRPKYAAFKMAMMALKAARVERPMARIAQHIRHMWAFGHVPKSEVYEPALAAAMPMDRRQPTLASEALAAGRLMADMLERGVRPNGQCFFLAVMANTQAKELTMACWLVKQLDEGRADLTNTDPGALRSCLTGVVLSCARAGRMDDAAYTLQVANKLGLRISAGALQAIFPFVAEALRCDLLRVALNGISQQVVTLARQTMPIKMDEGTLLAVLNAAAHEGDAALARMAWNLLERSLVQPTQRPLTAMPAAGAADADSAAALPGGGADHSAAPSAAAPGSSTAYPGSVPDQEQQQQQQLQREQGLEAASAASDSVSGATQRQLRLEPDLKLDTPCVAAFQSMIHALAAGDDLRGAYTFVRHLARQHADVPSATAWHSLPSLVDQIALSVAKIDEAYFVLEDMHNKGEEVTTGMVNIIIAACCQVGDLARAFETYEAMPSLGLAADVDTYNALMWGCSHYGQNASVPKLLEELQGAGFEPSPKTHELRVDSAIIAADIPGMLAALQDLVASGQQPGIALLERCVMRAERSADVPALRLLMGRLDLLNYKIVGAAAKLRRWDEEGGMPVLVGTERFVSRPMSGGYRHPDIIREPMQQQLQGDEQGGSLEPDIAHEDWGAAGLQQPRAGPGAAAHM